MSMEAIPADLMRAFRDGLLDAGRELLLSSVLQRTDDGMQKLNETSAGPR
eukprot:CAMPEP_0198270494 /NCGR_PEP_ID=MMETSP1447-20131203/45268_1 /TAXON_ID=420782 /ORGANISM="Chaetoceros dichaeta, Strain CCMP1751" /LENGTH=49 /DNA_ID=CAMNT_0043962551 /DNA_START=59 /DNA_END=211 /DNA_ORIENTATION=+